MSAPDSSNGVGPERKYADAIGIGFLLSLVGGFLDAYSFLAKGGVFANAQTGNLVLLFVSLANAEFAQSVKYAVPILTFALGIFLSDFAKGGHRLGAFGKIKVVLSIECALILFVGLFERYLSDSIVNCVISLIAAIQVAHFDTVGGLPVATTMITGNLKSGMIQLSRYARTKDEKHARAFGKYGIIILGFGLGVVIGAFSVRYHSGKSILVCILFLLLSLAMAHAKERKARASA